ncbi:hypothetical protein [Rhizobium sp. SSA_523]|nr:hypothetical protein [Rhizobium sp. SSA_523]MCO5734806.1 hypothetical protein [Rhizobium sp. SSA_523]WKC21055.1 hypothetical protein QTJ18_01105 [Rhizobium sp. SSA_523]
MSAILQQGSYAGTCVTIVPSHDRLDPIFGLMRLIFSFLQKTSPVL